MFNYPMSFTVHADAANGTNAPWQINAQEHKAFCAIPPEFGGPGGAFSPEDLFAQALTNCFVATFKVYADASKVSFERLRADGVLTVDLNDSKKPVMKKFTLQATISGASNEARVKAVAEKAFASGFILNSVKTELDLQLSLEAGAS